MWKKGWGLVRKGLMPVMEKYGFLGQKTVFLRLNRDSVEGKRDDKTKPRKFEGSKRELGMI